MIRAAIPDDIDRVLKPGALSFHCFDIIIRPGGRQWVTGLIPRLYGARAILNPWKESTAILGDSQTSFVSETAYNTPWKPILKLFYAGNGFPVWYNLLWHKP